MTLTVKELTITGSGKQVLADSEHATETTATWWSKKTRKSWSIGIVFYELQ